MSQLMRINFCLPSLFLHSHHELDSVPYSSLQEDLWGSAGTAKDQSLPGT